MPKRIRFVDQVQFVRIRHDLTVFSDIGQDYERRSRAVRANLRRFQGAKAAAESNVLLVGQWLIRENKDGVFGEPLAQRREGFIIQIAPQVEIRDAGAKAGM